MGAVRCGTTVTFGSSQERPAQVRVVLLQAFDEMRIGQVVERPVPRADRSMHIVLFQMIQKLLN